MSFAFLMEFDGKVEGKVPKLAMDDESNPVTAFPDLPSDWDGAFSTCGDAGARSVGKRGEPPLKGEEPAWKAKRVREKSNVEVLQKARQG